MFLQCVTELHREDVHRNNKIYVYILYWNATFIFYIKIPTIFSITSLLLTEMRMDMNPQNNIAIDIKHLLKDKFSRKYNILHVRLESLESLYL